MRFLRQSSSVTVTVGPFLDSTDGVSAETGLTIAQADVRLSKNDGSFAQKSETSSATHKENGFYSVSLNTTDTGTVGAVVLGVSKSGAVPVWEYFWVLEEAIYDALFAASATGALPVSSSGITSSSFAAGAINAAAIADSAIDAATFAAGAINAAAIADGAIDAATFASGAINAAAIAADAIGASELASDAVTEIAAGVWATSTRTLSAGDNIVLAKGTGVTGFNDPSASDVSTAVWDETTRTLTAGDNIVLAKGTGITGLNDPSASTISTTVWGETTRTLTAGDNIVLAKGTGITGFNDPSASDISAAVLAVLKGQETRGTAQAGGASTITLATGASSTDDFYNSAMIILLEGTGTDSLTVAQRTRQITDYVGSTRVATVDDAWATEPDSDTIYLVVTG